MYKYEQVIEYYGNLSINDDNLRFFTFGWFRRSVKDSFEISISDGTIHRALNELCAKKVLEYVGNGYQGMYFDIQNCVDYVTRPYVVDKLSLAE